MNSDMTFNDKYIVLQISANTIWGYRTFLHKDTIINKMNTSTQFYKEMNNEKTLKEFLINTIVKDIIFFFNDNNLLELVEIVKKTKFHIHFNISINDILQSNNTIFVCDCS